VFAVGFVSDCAGAGSTGLSCASPELHSRSIAAKDTMEELSRISVFSLEIVARGGQRHEQFPVPAVEEQADFSARLYAENNLVILLGQSAHQASGKLAKG
jgi:hypothetical protein